MNPLLHFDTFFSWANLGTDATIGLTTKETAATTVTSTLRRVARVGRTTPGGAFGFGVIEFLWRVVMGSGWEFPNKGGLKGLMI